MKTFILYAISLTLFSNSLSKAESFDQLQKMFEAAAPPTIESLVTDAVWTGIVAPAPGVSVTAPYPLLVIYKDVDPLGGSNTYALSVNADSFNFSIQDVLRESRELQAKEYFFPVVMNTNVNALVTVGSPGNQFQLAYLMRQTRTEKGEPAIVEKAICYTSSGCRALTYGQIMFYSLYTNMTVAAPTLMVSQVVEVTVDSDLYSGSSVVGHLAKGEKARIASLQNGWASLTKMDGTAIQGWIPVANLKPTTP